MPDQIVNIQDYRCVPLDLLKNVDKDGNVELKVTPTSTSLKEIRDETKSDLLGSGTLGTQTFSAQTTEGIIIFIFVVISILSVIGLFFLGKGAWMLFRIHKLTYWNGIAIGVISSISLASIIIAPLIYTNVIKI